MGCATGTVKFLLFTFNLIFSLGGLALLIYGSIVLANKIDFFHFFSGDELRIPSIVLIVIGSSIFVISFMGCCGTVRESRCMLITFSVLVFIIFVVLLALGIVVVVTRATIQEGMEKAIKKSMTKFQNEYTTSETAKENWDLLQTAYHCCGQSTSAEWSHFNVTTLPQSCSCVDGPDCAGHVYKQGCYSAFTNYINKFISKVGGFVGVGGISIGVGMVALVGLIFACTISSHIKKKSDRWDV